MNIISVRRLLSFTMVMVFFLTNIPYGHANTSMRPATSEQAQIMEIMKDLHLDQESMSQTKASQLALMRNSLLPSEFDDVRAYLISKKWDPHVNATFRTAIVMTFERMEMSKINMYMQVLGITDATLIKMRNLPSIASWVENNSHLKCIEEMTRAICLAAVVFLIIASSGVYSSYDYPYNVALPPSPFDPDDGSIRTPNFIQLIMAAGSLIIGLYACDYLSTSPQ
ncbi:MAG: hypothetical protein CSYNP_03759 [Syntrophus sp. SKADARSKE-3]|nr:hypothetical protein [Syntrophus sp. SKADARSKE-3]